MRPTHLSLLVFVIGALGCSHNAYSPPSAMSIVESPATVGRERFGIQGQISGGRDFWRSVTGIEAAARIRYGITDNVDVSAQVGFARLVLDLEPDEETDANRNLFGARLGAKWAPVQHFALFGGLGVATSAGGAAISPEVGLIAGFENRYIVPYAFLRGFISAPMSAQEVDVGNELDTPELTYGLFYGPGIRVPIQNASLLLQAQFGHIADDDASEFVMIGSFGFEGTWGGGDAP